MNPEPEQYLWDGVGTPDPGVQHLEQILSSFRHSQPLRELPELQPAWWSRRGRWWARPVRAAAFAAAMAALLILLGPWTIRRVAHPGAAWSARALSGSPRINGRPLAENDEFRNGGLLETDSGSQAEVRIGLIGRITVLPNTRLRRVETRSGKYRMALERGKISARTLAPPFTFVVDTPGATAYDLGCAFTLETDERGTGLLRVTSGWVQLEFDDRQALIPAGAVSRFQPGMAPGTPYFEDSSEAFRSALWQLDFVAESPQARAASLDDLLAAARRRDVYSLFEMLKTLRGAERRRVLDRAMEILPPPPGVTRAGLLRGDEPMMYAWRKETGLGDVKRWWIHWRDILPE
jgi:hypothetical protein